MNKKKMSQILNVNQIKKKGVPKFFIRILNAIFITSENFVVLKFNEK